MQGDMKNVNRRLRPLIWGALVTPSLLTWSARILAEGTHPQKTYSAEETLPKKHHHHGWHHVKPSPQTADHTNRTEEKNLAARERVGGVRVASI